jgi:protein gp37
MADHTTIEWVAALAKARGAIPSTWNPIEGCSRASDGCRGCYAAAMQRRFRPELVDVAPDGHARFNGTVNFMPGRLAIPLKAKKPRVYFVGDMADLFHPSVKDEWLDQVFAVMALCPRHTFLLLTKRPERMREYLASAARGHAIGMGALHLTLEAHQQNRRSNAGAGVMMSGDPARLVAWPLPNVWLGTTVEHQAAADERIPQLLATPAAKRFISAEPLLGPLSFRWQSWHHEATSETYRQYFERVGSISHLESIKGIDWVIAGGESGPGARPMHPDWVRALRDQCGASRVPFLFKQWGAWLDVEEARDILGDDDSRISDQQHRRSGKTDLAVIGNSIFVCVGKKSAGRLLDGCTWDEVPS